MNTWLEDFNARTDLNKYPVALRTRGGIGYKKPNGETVSNFVGHPVHYLDNGIWKPITLQPHSNGDFEGSDFSWRGKQVFYKGKTLFEPHAVIFNGTRHQLFLRQDGNVIRADLPFGQYTIRITESGVREELTIPEPIEGLIEFDVPHAQKPETLRKTDRHIVGGAFGESFQLTKDMTYPLVIDPDYSGDTADGYVYGSNATYSTARATSAGYDTTGELFIMNATGYQVRRSFAKFDTSGIPDGDTISSVVMSLYLTTKVISTNWDVQIKKQDWSAQDPISAGNREAIYDNCLTATLDDNIWQNTSAISTGNRYDSGNLSTSWVSKTGYTYYSLLSKQDNDNTTPTTNSYIAVASQNYPTSGNRPYLTVTHAAVATLPMPVIMY